MKFTKKKVFVIALAICLLATLSVGTLAWFSGEDSVKNEFYVADSTEKDPDELFSLDVYEYTDDSPVDKVPTGETYEEILPGDHLKKEPHVANTGYYDQYIRVIVTISDATAWINAVGVDFQIEDVFEGYDATMWNNISKDINGETDTVTYVLYYNGILDGADTTNDATSGTVNDIVLFNYVNIPETLTQEQAAALKGGFSINVKAQAVQTENVGANAFEAFQTVNMGY